MIHPDLRRAFAHQEFHEQVRRIEMLGALHDAGGRDNQNGAVGGIDHGKRLPFWTLSRRVPTGPDPAMALSPALSIVTVSLIERPTRGLFLASFSKNSQPY